jgi:hypothetical protein
LIRKRSLRSALLADIRGKEKSPRRIFGFQDRCIKPLCHPSKSVRHRSVTAKYVIEETGVNGKRKRLFFKTEEEALISVPTMFTGRDT